ncbi:glycosyltransferase [Candidatus Saccharibacteria bacterium]|nr:glycosyltransferase [Candidatus Saccharibacteria bacterium]
MKTPSVSVILPNYNYAQFFSSRLDEVLSQSYPVSEIIILDDASTDASVSCINTKLAKIKDDYPAINFKTDFNSKNSGSVFSQWQKGIELAESDYIWIAELDDSADSEFLKTAIEPISKDSDVVLSYTNSRLIGSVSIKDRLRVAYDFMRTKRSINGYVTTGATEVEKSLAVFNSIPNVSACIIKNLPNLSKILDGSKGFKLSGDWYLYLNLLTQGKIAYSPKKLNAHRLSKTSVTSQTDLKIRFREMQTIHTLASDLYDLSDSTKARIKKTEDSLRTSWGIA